MKKQQIDVIVREGIEQRAVKNLASEYQVHAITTEYPGVITIFGGQSEILKVGAWLMGPMMKVKPAKVLDYFTKIGPRVKPLSLEIQVMNVKQAISELKKRKIKAETLEGSDDVYADILVHMPDILSRMIVLRWMLDSKDYVISDIESYYNGILNESADTPPSNPLIAAAIKSLSNKSILDDSPNS